MRIGAHYSGDGKCEFTLWAPKAESIAVQILAPQERVVPLNQQGNGYWHIILDDLYPGSLYRYQLNNYTAYPDPVSQFQPQGVHGPSEIISPDFEWTDQNWSGIALKDYILYEAHVGTFSPEGTFEGIIPHLQKLRDLGITALEIMPIAQFPGDKNADLNLTYRNWGYDGVYPFAVQNSYGGVHGFKRLVDACHQVGIAVVLDVVYNHFGPEGNYMSQFAPYFTETYRTPWGSAINFDDAYSQEVRHYFLENALYWLRDFHVDALRLDAVHAIYDLGAKHFLVELAQAVKAFSQRQGREYYLIAESDLNDPKLIRSPEIQGYGLDAQWSDDFHHALHAVVTGDNQGYYQDFGKVSHLAKAYTETFVYDWKYAPHRKRFHGMPCLDCPPQQFVVCNQNHDQIGNQMLGERLSQRVSFSALKLVAAAILLSPYLPLLFMGEEYGETAPFTYFVSHSDPDLIKAVRNGRKKEFEAFHFDGEPLDPEGIETFLNCKLNWDLCKEGKHQVLWNFYQHLIRLRQTHPALKCFERNCISASSDDEKQILILYRWSDDSALIWVTNFNQKPVEFQITLPEGKVKGQKILDSAEAKWMGEGSLSPESLEASQTITIQSESLVLYEL